MDSSVCQSSHEPAVSFQDPYGTKVRARRPCDSCRRRKSRCEMTAGKQLCLLCRFHHQECTFNEEPKPRKRRAVALIQELNTATYVSSSQVTEGTVSPYKAPQQPSVIRQDPPVDDYAKLKGPSLLKSTLGLQSHVHSRLLGSTSVFDPILLELHHDQMVDEKTQGWPALRKLDPNGITFIQSSDTVTLSYQNDIPDLDAIETIVAPHGQALIHLYFRIVHPSFPILHKKVYLEKYQRTHREFSPPLLAAVYLLALNWWPYSSELSMLKKPDVSRLESLALKTMAHIIHRPKLSTIQAGVLLLQRPNGDSWGLTCQLVGLGQDMGLHLDCTTWRIPRWEIGLRKRLAWAVFAQDKWGALVHGRPSHIRPADWEPQSLHERDFPETAKDEDHEDGSTEVEKGRAIFCEFIKLTEILSLILSAFYSLTMERQFASRAHEGVRWILDKAKPLQLALRQWHSDLPVTLRIEDIAERKLSSIGYLHLCYYAVEMTLHRRIVSSLSSVDESSLRNICREAAQARLQSAVNFVQNLRPEHLQSFWYSSSKYNFALVGTFISLLWATSTGREEAGMYQARLDEYRWLLRLSSKSADFLEQSLGLLATSTGVLIKAIPEVPNINRILSRCQSRGERSEHTGLIITGTASQITPLPQPSDLGLCDNYPDAFFDEAPFQSDATKEAWMVQHELLNTLDVTATSYLSFDDVHAGLDFEM